MLQQQQEKAREEEMRREMEDREMALKIWQDTPVVESPAKMVLRNVLNFFQLPFISKTSSRIKKYMHDLQGPSHSASLPDTVTSSLRALASA